LVYFQSNVLTLLILSGLKMIFNILQLVSKYQSHMKMRKPLIVFTTSLFLCFAGLTHAQTTLNGGEISGVLAKSGSPYQIKGDLLVPKDSVLTIEAGVVMNFDTAKLVRVDGCIKVNGTKTEPVSFTCVDSLIGWLGMFFIDNVGQDTSIFNYTKIQYGNVPKNVVESPLFTTNRHSNGNYYAPYIISAYNAAPIKLIACKLRKNWKTCDVEDGHIEFIDCVIYDNLQKYGIYVNGGFGTIFKSYGKVKNCRFMNNEYGSFYFGGNLNFSDPGIIDSCYFENNQLEIVLNSTRIPVRNCTWKNNKCAVLAFGGDNRQTIENCVFDGTYGTCPRGGDIRVFGDASEAVVKNCVFKNKSSYITSATIDGGSPTFEGCIFRDNIYGPYLAPGSTDGRFVNCLFTGNQLSLPAASDVTVINSSFVNNIHQIKDPNNAAVVDSASGAAVSTGGKFTFYNTLFWGNTDYFGRINNFTIRTGQTDQKFYNCIIEEGQKSIYKEGDRNYSFSGSMVDCDSAAPTFINPSSSNFRLKTDCSGTSIGFNMGYDQPIAMSYLGVSYSDILAQINTDLDGKARVYDGLPDVGAYEIQALADRIDVVDTLVDASSCAEGQISLYGSANTIGLLTEWQKWDGTRWKFVSNADQPVVLSPVTAADSGAQYRISWINGCSVSKISDTATVHVFTPASYKITSDSLRITTTETMVLVGPNNFTTYQWSNGKTTKDITIDGANLGLGDHTFNLEAIDANGCSSSDSITITVTKHIGIGQLAESGLYIYPNPSKGQLNFSQPFFGQCTITDLMGKVVYNEEAQGLTTLNATHLKEGTYIISLIDTEGNMLRLKMVMI
jgi:hypothetical protein